MAGLLASYSSRILGPAEIQADSEVSEGETACILNPLTRYYNIFPPPLT
jgi:hypothetical protein